MKLVNIGLGWVCGILIAASFPAIIPLFWVLMLGISVGLATYFRKANTAWVLIFAVALTFGGFRYGFVEQTSDIARYNDVGGATLVGIIIGEPDIRDDRVQIRLDVETIQLSTEIIETSGNVLINAPRVSDVVYGDRIRVTGQLATPAVYDTFSYADYLARDGVFTIMDRATIEIISRGHGQPFVAWVFDFKAKLMMRIQTALPAPESALLTGILLGNERGISPALAEAFTRVGAAHIIAISGFNMAIIAGLVQGFLERWLPQRKWLATIISLIVITIYTFLVGANAAVVRAAFMSGLVIIARQLNRRSFVPASLALVAIIMSALQPRVLWDLSFQLSFFAVLGLVLFTEPLQRFFDRMIGAIMPPVLAKRVSAFLQEPLVVSIAALVMTLPLTMLYFNRLSLVALLVNLLIVPVQGAILLVGGFALLLAIFLPWLAEIFFWLDMILLRWTIGVVRYFGQLPYADIEIRLPAEAVWGLFAVIIGGAILDALRPTRMMRFGSWLRRKPILPLLSTVALGLLMLLLTIYNSRPDGRLHVWLLDVGHSNAVLIETPDGAHILIDGGRFPSRLLTSIGDRIPFYDRELELIVITHPDEFDVGALPAILRRYNAGVILTNGQPNLGDAYAEIETSFTPQSVVAVRAGYTIEFSDGTLLEVLHPQATPDLADNINDHVIVMRVSYGDVSILLTSDISQVGQQAMLDAGQWVGAGVMQLPQHATARSLSRTFYAQVDPQVALVQYDAANRRGDPDSDVLLDVGDIPLFTTGEAGTLHLWTNGRTLWSVSEDF